MTLRTILISIFAFALQISFTQPIAAYQKHVVGGILQVPAGFVVVSSDSSDWRQELKIANGPDTIFLGCWNSGIDLYQQQWPESYRTLYSDNYCPRYYDNPAYETLPAFRYSSEDGINWHTAKLDSIIALNDHRKGVAQAHIRIIDNAIDSFTSNMEFEMRIRQAFSDLVDYRKSLNDSTEITGRVMGQKILMTLKKSWIAPEHNQSSGSLVAEQPEHDRVMWFDISAVITRHSTLDLFVYLLKNAILRKEQL